VIDGLYRAHAPPPAISQLTSTGGLDTQGLRTITAVVAPVLLTHVRDFPQLRAECRVHNASAAKAKHASFLQATAVRPTAGSLMRLGSHAVSRWHKCATRREKHQ
jgi:hypothetical protein